MSAQAKSGRGPPVRPHILMYERDLNARECSKKSILTSFVVKNLFYLAFVLD